MLLTGTLQVGVVGEDPFLDDLDGGVGEDEEGGGEDISQGPGDVAGMELLLVEKQQKKDHEQVKQGIVLFEENLLGIKGAGIFSVGHQTGDDTPDPGTVVVELRAIFIFKVRLFGQDDEIILAAQE